MSKGEHYFVTCEHYTESEFVSISKVLSEHSHGRPFAHHVWLRSCSRSTTEQLLQRPCSLPSLKYSLSRRVFVICYPAK